MVARKKTKVQVKTNNSLPQVCSDSKGPKNEDILQNLSRSELQKRCKSLGLKANGKASFDSISLSP